MTEPRPWLARLREPVWLLVAAVLLAMACDRSGIDIRLARWAVTAPPPQQRLAQWITPLGEAQWWLIPAAGLAAYGFWTGRRWVTRPAVLAFIVIAVAGLAVHPFKWMLGRMRPKLLLEEGLYGYAWFEPGYAFASMPSGHSAVAGAGAVVLTRLAPRSGVVLAPLLLALALTRVQTLSHYLGDVVMGFALGAAVAMVIWPADRRAGTGGPSRL